MFRKSPEAYSLWLAELSALALSHSHGPPRREDDWEAKGQNPRITTV